MVIMWSNWIQARAFHTAQITHILKKAVFVWESLYGITSYLADWPHVPSSGDICLWSPVPSEGLSQGGRTSVWGGGLPPLTDPTRTVNSGWYTSYWNAFLFLFYFLLRMNISRKVLARLMLELLWATKIMNVLLRTINTNGSCFFLINITFFYFK